MVIVGRGIREGFAGAAVDREAASAQDIGILGVAGGVAGGVDAGNAGGSIEVADGEEGGEAGGGEGGEVNAEDFDFFACFVRTCS